MLDRLKKIVSLPLASGSVIPSESAPDFPSRRFPSRDCKGVPRASFSRLFKPALSLLIPLALSAQYHLGRPVTPDEVRDADITVLPDGRGLPPGHGSAAAGEAIFTNRCAFCHGPKGGGRKGEYPALVGGRGTLGTAHPVKTVGSYWPYATTVFDHINRAMPFNTPHVLPPDDVYSVTAYILFLNGIVARDFQLTEKTLPGVVMPNRNGFIPDQRPDIKAKR